MGRLDPQRRLNVRLDGQELLEARLDFAPGGEVTSPANAEAARHCPAPFSGEVLEVRRAFGGPAKDAR